MARQPRRIVLGGLYHVTNRGIGKRTVFESDRDKRRFLAEVARCVHNRWIRVWNYAVLPTHFHLFLQDRDGNLSLAMQRLQSAFAMWFNRTRSRDGAVFRGRFYARHVVEDHDRAAVHAYVEHNPVAAELARFPEEYPYCSARDRHTRRRRHWLERSSTQSVVRGPTADEIWVVERALRHRLGRPCQAPWMVQRILNADNMPTASTSLGPAAMRVLLDHVRPSEDLLAGLWRYACGLTLSETAAAMGMSVAVVRRLSHELHVRFAGRAQAKQAVFDWIDKLGSDPNMRHSGA